MSTLVHFLQPQQHTPEQQHPWQRRILNSLQQTPEVIDAVVALMQAASFTDKDVFALRLVLEEGLVNGLKHGNHCDPKKCIELRYRLDGDGIIVEIEDEGDGFRPEDVPNPLAPENMERASGRGLLLMRSYTDWLEHNACGNCVRFARRRK